MLANERQRTIGELLRKNGAVTVSALIEAFDVSIETVRRDLLALEQKGVLTRVHGGAVAENHMRLFSSLSDRNKEFEAQKHALSAAAMAFINEGDILAVDSGSTAVAFARALRDTFTRLTVVTHSLDVFHLLCDHKEFQVILCGGHYMRNENSFYGALTLDMLDKLQVQKAFIFPSAVSLKHGIGDFEKDLFQIQQRLVSRADSVFVLADSHKFEKKALLKLADMRSDFRYVTDGELSEELKRLYADNGLSVTVAD